MPKFKVRDGCTVRAGGKFRGAGDLVELSKEAAEELVLSGHIEPVESKPVVEPKGRKQPEGVGAGDNVGGAGG